MPKSAMNPTEAGADKYERVKSSPKTPPTSARGTLTTMISACRRLPYDIHKSTKTPAMTMGTMIDKRRMARCWFS